MFGDGEEHRARVAIADTESVIDPVLAHRYAVAIEEEQGRVLAKKCEGKIAYGRRHLIDDVISVLQETPDGPLPTEGAGKGFGTESSHRLLNTTVPMATEGRVVDAASGASGQVVQL